MWNVKRQHIVTLAVTLGVLSIIYAWMVAVVLKNLIGDSFMDSVEGAKSAGIYKVVFLDGAPFETTVVLCIATALLLASGNALLSFMALKRSEQYGREIRRTILQCATDSSNGGDAVSTDIHRVANDMIVNVKLVEDYQAFDEHFVILYNTMIAVTLVLINCFTWYGGLVTISLYCLSEVSSAAIERARKSSFQQVEQNIDQVNARLMDDIKNSTMIQIMGTSYQEQQALFDLEHQADSARKVDARYRFTRDITCRITTFLISPIMMIVAWNIIQGAETASEALDRSYAVLVSVMLLEPAHKAITSLSYIHDREVGALNAQLAIDAFLSRNPKRNYDSDTTRKSDEEASVDDLFGVA
jgi:ABC-type multidrug transport system fused ATPase/permease subunit